MRHLTFSLHDWIFVIFLFCAAVVLSNVAHYFVFRYIHGGKPEARERSGKIESYLTWPARTVFLLICLLIVLPFVPRIPGLWMSHVSQFFEILLVLAMGWLAISGVYLFEVLTLRRFDVTAKDNLRARRIHTQMQFIRRMIIAGIVVLDAVALLWSFHDPDLWKWGTGLLASAGLASLLLAAAAKSTVANLLAGLQIALSEPIRIDDVVVLESYWGRVEEITSTYVVVKVWDERRLVVPLAYFIENPFENWTRRRADILGTSFLYVDYSIPVEPLRAELTRIVHESSLWDGRVCGLQVTNLSERTMELRCLVSSADASKNFDLRCDVREKMIDFIRREYPNALPTVRFEARNEKQPEPALSYNGSQFSS